MKKRNKVDFSYFEVYFFGRCLGTDKVPESGNNPLGMEDSHFFSTKVDIFQRNINEVLHNGDNIITSTPQSKFITGNNNIFYKTSSDRDSLQSVLSIDYTTKSLQPMNPKQRIKCLKEAGVEFIKNQLWTDEGKDLIKLRLQRQQVGCKCSGKNNCDPDKCICSKEGIPCQSDSNKFPCKCGPNCSNVSGKRIYSHLRTKYHYRHTFESNLIKEMYSNELSVKTDNGDCQMCKNISEDSLKELFVEPALPNRKRGTNVQNKNMPKSQKSKEDMEILTPVVNTSFISNVMTLSSLPSSNFHVGQSINFDDLFTFVKSTEKEVEKENLHESVKDDKLSDIHIISFSSPINTRSTLSPIQLPSFTHTRTPQFNDSWSYMELYETNLSNQNETFSPLAIDDSNAVDNGSYWNSFLNFENFYTKNQSPLLLAKSNLNPISLATEVSTPKSVTSDIFNNDESKHVLKPIKVAIEEKSICSSPLIIDINADGVKSKMQSYKFRRSAFGNLFYYESPMDRSQRKKIRTQTIYKTMSKKNNSVKEKKNIVTNISYDDAETETLIENIAEISLLKFVGIVTRNDEGNADRDLIEEVAQDNPGDRL